MVVAKTLDALLVQHLCGQDGYWCCFLELQASGPCCPIYHWGRVHCCSGSQQGNSLVMQSAWGNGLLCQFPLHPAQWQPVCHLGGKQPRASWMHEAPGFVLVLAEGCGGSRCYFTSVSPQLRCLLTFWPSLWLESRCNSFARCLDWPHQGGVRVSEVCNHEGVLVLVISTSSY